MNHKAVRRMLLLAACVLPASGAYASCHGPQGPAFSPGLSPELEIRFRPKGSGAPGLERARVSGIGELQLPSVDLDPEVLKNEPFNAQGGFVAFLKPDGKGGKQLCRTEMWERRPVGNPQISGYPYPPSAEHAPSHPALLKVYPYYYLKEAYDYYYDDLERLSEVRRTRIPTLGIRTEAEMQEFYPQNRLAYCVRYDERGRLYAETEEGDFISTDPAFRCSELGSNPTRERFKYFLYNVDGSFSAWLTSNFTRKPGENSSKPDTGFGTQATDGDWYGEGPVFLQNIAQKNERASAYLHYNQRNGLTRLKTDYFEFIPSDAQPLFAQRATYANADLQYTFPAEPVPLSVITGNMEGITGYTRVRTYLHRSGRRIFEIFDPNRSTPRQRLWYSANLTRQEDYDAHGRLKRVINSGPANAQAYAEDLRAYAESGVLKLTPRTGGYASYRVYDYDASGKETLSLVCWAHESSVDRPYDHFPWWQPDPRPKLRSNDRESIYRMKHISNNCGTPDGKATVIGMGPADKMMRDRYGFGTTTLRILRD